MKGFKGLRNTVDPERLKDGELVTANNVDLDKTGRISRRTGYSQANADAAHSLFSNGELCLYVSATSLKRLATDYSSTILATVTAGARMAYCHENGRTYYTNGHQTGIVQDGASRSWGLSVPGLPMATNTVGNLPPGRYQYVMTYIRADGQESGAGLAGEVDVTDGGISFTDIPVSDDAEVAYKMLYLTPANGDVLYQALLLDNADTTASYGDDGLNLQVPLRTQFMQGAPAGQIIGYYKGRLYVVDGNIVYPSQAYSPELFDLRDFIPYGDRITLFAPVENGIWLGTEKEVGWIGGNGPEDFTYDKKADYGAIFGTLAYHFQQTKNGDIKFALFVTDLGICAGYPGGTFVNLTEQDYRYIQPNEGCALLRSPTTGLTQYLTVLR